MEDDGKHEFKAVDVSGVSGGKLMCETQAENLTKQEELLDHVKLNKQKETKRN